jgi:hypothetical protein
LAGKFVRHLQRQQKDIEGQKMVTEDQQQRDEDKEKQDIGVSEKEEKCLRLAGLCHDLGKSGSIQCMLPA